jgi:Tol biopolymer transport system component
MNADGTHLHTIGRCEVGCRPAWSPDGQTIASVKDAGNSEIQLTTLSGRTSTLRPCAGSHCVSPTNPIWSPDGKRLTFSVGRDETVAVWTVRRDGSGLRRITDDADSCCVAWIRRSGPLGRVLPPMPSGAAPHLSGTVLFDRQNGLDLLSLRTGRVTRLRVTSNQYFDEPSWSPGGREIAFSRPDSQLYVVSRDGNLRELTNLSWPGEAKQPAWSPNGQDIAFVTSDDAIDVIQPDGTAPIRQLPAHGENPSWAPSGRELVFDKQYVSGPQTLFTIRTDGTAPTRLTHLGGDQINPAWSPSGHEIAFEWDTDAGSSVYLIRPDGTHLRRVTTQAIPTGRPAWSPDGRYLLLFSISSSETSSGVVVVNVRTGRVTTLYPKIPFAWSAPSWTSR